MGSRRRGERRREREYPRPKIRVFAGTWKVTISFDRHPEDAHVEVLPSIFPPGAVREEIACWVRQQLGIVLKLHDDIYNRIWKITDEDRATL